MNATTSGALPEVGVADAVAVGGWFPAELAAIATDDDPVAPLLSVTVSVAVKFPAV